MEIDGTAVVMGAGSGIGRALAVAFGAAGAQVAIADVETRALQETAAMVRATGATVLAQVVDVRDADPVRAFAAAVDAELGGADILCNNAGVFAGGTIWERPIADYEWVMGVNFYGVVHGIQAFVPGMIERGRPGHIVNTSSMAGLFAGAFSSAYSCSKFAVVALSESLAGELAAAGAPIGVTVLCPGAVRTGIHESIRNRPESERTAPSPSSDFVDEMLTNTTQAGLDPTEVAPMILDAIRANRFLQFTHEVYADALRVRTDELLRGVVPALPIF